MKQPFYLVSTGLGDPISVRECVYLRTILAQPSKKQLHLTSVSPCVESVGYLGDRIVADTLLLLTIDELSLEQTIVEEFMVDIYFSKGLPSPPCDVIDVADILRLGAGTLLPTRSKAAVRLARELKPWDTRD